MKQVKSLVLAVFLVLTISVGAHGGDIGSPGIKTTTSGDIGSPTATSTTNVYPGDDTSGTDTDSTSDLEDSLLVDMMVALLSLI